MVVLATLATSSPRRRSSPARSRCRRRPMQLGFLPRLRRSGRPRSTRAARSTCRRSTGRCSSAVLLRGARLPRPRRGSPPPTASRSPARSSSTRCCSSSSPGICGTGARWQLALAGVVFGGRGADVPRRQPDQGRARRLAAAARSPPASSLVMTTWQRGARSSRRTGSSWRARCAIRRRAAREPGASRVPGHRRLPPPHEGHDAARAARERRAQPRAARARAHRVGAARRPSRTSTPVDRVTVDDLGYDDDGIYHVTVRFGFSESPDVPGSRAGSRPGPLESMPTSTRPRTSSPGPRSAPPRRPAWAAGASACSCAGAQRRQPGRLLRPAGRPDGRDGVARRGLTVRADPS